jgi:hypothetical protein
MAFAFVPSSPAGLHGSIMCMAKNICACLLVLSGYWSLEYKQTGAYGGSSEMSAIEIEVRNPLLNGAGHFEGLGAG